MFPAATAVTVATNVARHGVFSHFCLCVQVLLSLATFSRGLSRSTWKRLAGALRSVTDGSTFHPGLPRSVGTSTVCYVAIKFCYVYQVLSRFSTIKRGRWMVFEPKYAHDIKRRSTKLLKSLYYAPLIKNIITCNGNGEADFVFI